MGHAAPLKVPLAEQVAYTHSIRSLIHRVGVVEDELHLLYCPYYIDLRFQYNIHLTGAGQIDHSMHALVNAYAYDRWHALSNYLIACFKRRDDFMLRGLQLPSLTS